MVNSLVTSPVSFYLLNMAASKFKFSCVVHTCSLRISVKQHCLQLSVFSLYHQINSFSGKRNNFLSVMSKRCFHRDFKEHCEYDNEQRSF